MCSITVEYHHVLLRVANKDASLNYFWSLGQYKNLIKRRRAFHIMSEEKGLADLENLDIPTRLQYSSEPLDVVSKLARIIQKIT